MRAYLDTSILVALLTDDPLTPRANAFVGSAPSAVVSDVAAAEFASALGRRVRMGDIDVDRGRAVLADLDAWLARGVERVDLGLPADLRRAGDLRHRDGCGSPHARHPRHPGVTDRP